MNINDWLSDLTGGATDKDIAAKAGISARTLQHQTSSGKLSVENALKISVAYKRHPLRTLIDFDVIDASWAQVPDVQTALRLATDVQLTEEILRRLDLVDHDEILDTPIDIVAKSPLDIRYTRKQEEGDEEEDQDPIYSSTHSTFIGRTEQGESNPWVVVAKSGRIDDDSDHLPEDAAANDRDEEGATPEHFEP